MYYITPFSEDKQSDDDKIEVSKEFFEKSNLIRETLDSDENSIELPKEYFDKNVLMLLNSYLMLQAENNSMMLTKLLSLVHFLDIQLDMNLLIDKLIPSLNNLTDDNFDQFIDSKFASNCNLVSLLWNRTKEKKVLLKLSKFNYALLELNLNEDRSITQEDLYSMQPNLKNQIIAINVCNRYDIYDIYDVNMLTNLEQLYAEGDCGIDNNSIQGLTSLRVLHVKNNARVTNVNHLTNLEQLYADGYCGIDQNGIQGLTSLRELNAKDNKK
jgi:hypothetical protein